jgi:hypothetical protein
MIIKIFVNSKLLLNFKTLGSMSGKLDAKKNFQVRTGKKKVTENFFWHPICEATTKLYLCQWRSLVLTNI